VNIREVPGYVEAVEAIRKDVAAFKLGWAWPQKSIRGMVYGRCDDQAGFCRAIELEPTFENMLPEKVAKRIFEQLLPSARELPRTVFGPYVHDPDDPSGEKSFKRGDDLRTAVYEDVQESLLPIAKAIIDRSVKAIEGKDVEKHNRRVHLETLFQPIQKALWDGVTVQEIADLAKTIWTKGPKEEPTFKEVWAQLQAQIKAKGG
jgi:hypothetical protein